MDLAHREQASHWRAKHGICSAGTMMHSWLLPLFIALTFVSPARAQLPPAPTPVPGSLLDDAPPASSVGEGGARAVTNRARRPEKRGAPDAALRPGNPVPAAAVTTVALDTARLPRLDTLTTRSGRWHLFDAGRDADRSIYVWTLDRRPNWARVMICRDAFTHEAGQTRELSLVITAVTLRHRGETHKWRVLNPQGSCKIAQTGEPVEPNLEWVRDAAITERTVAVLRERMWQPWRFKPYGTEEKRAGYDPADLGGTGSSRNYVGIISAQGGEYASSRGFYNDEDAQIVDAALHGEDAAIRAGWGRFTAVTHYLNGFPQRVVWSARNHIVRDPIFPLSGDRMWEFADAGARKRDDVDSVLPTAKWGEDTAHLRNQCWVHWIATEDPVAALCLNMQLAMGLATNYEWRWGKVGSRLAGYQAYVEQQRGVYNVLSSIWKMADVASRIRSETGRVIWSADRIARIKHDVFTYYDNRFNKPVREARRGATTAYLRKLANMIFDMGHFSKSKLADGTTMDVYAGSQFMDPQYGTAVMHLWASTGDPMALRWYRVFARRAVVRVLYMPGGRGIDSSRVGGGSSMPLGPASGKKPVLPPYADDIGYAKWVMSIPMVRGHTDNYNSNSIHTLTQIEGQLLSAIDLAKRGKIAPIADAEKAYALMQELKARTDRPGYPALIMAKHLFAPRSMVPDLLAKHAGVSRTAVPMRQESTR